MRPGFQNKTLFSQAFEKPVTDPKCDLLAYIEDKQDHLISYTRRPDANKGAIDRATHEISMLYSILDKLYAMKFYHIWV